MAGEFLKITDVAKRLGVHYNTAYRLVTNGDLAATKVGTQWRVSPTEVERFIAKDNPSNGDSLDKPIIYAVVNQKGGVGKSTITVNLSEALVTLGKRVLIIDIDPQGNSTSHIGVNTSALPTIKEVLLDNFPTSEAIQKTSFGIDIIPADIGLSEAELELFTRMNRESILGDSLRKANGVINQYDFILIDCPPSLGLLTVNALSIADFCLIPVSISKFAMDGIKLLVRTVSELRQETNKNLKIGHFVITQADHRMNITKEFIDALSTSLPYSIAKTVIKHRKTILEAPFNSVPVGIYDPDGEAAQMFIELAKEILGGEVNGGENEAEAQLGTSSE